MNICLQPVNMSSKVGQVATFATALKSARNARGLTQRQLIERCGNQFTESYVSQLENGKRHENGELIRPSRDVVDSLADALRKSRTEFRKLTGYSAEGDESSIDEITSEFGHMLAKYKQVPEGRRSHIKTIVDAAIELALEKDAKAAAKTKVVKPKDERAQTIVYADPSEIPPISIEDAMKLSRQHQMEKDKRKAPKGPRKSKD